MEILRQCRTLYEKSNQQPVFASQFSQNLKLLDIRNWRMRNLCGWDCSTYYKSKVFPFQNLAWRVLLDLRNYNMPTLWETFFPRLLGVLPQHILLIFQIGSKLKKGIINWGCGTTRTNYDKKGNLFQAKI
jgi:hypothetical protein